MYFSLVGYVFCINEKKLSFHISRGDKKYVALVTLINSFCGIVEEPVSCVFYLAKLMNKLKNTEQSTMQHLIYFSRPKFI